MMLFWVIMLVATMLAGVIAVQTSQIPKNSKPQFPTRALLGGAAVLAGAVGKKLYDGPAFNEPVDLTGKVIAITGSNTGLGFESAKKLASLGKPEIIMLCRNEQKAKAAIDKIFAQTGNPNLSYIQCDLEDLKSVAAAAQELKAKHSRLDVLQLNSGVMAIPTREVTKDGFEKHLGINHLGHFALTRDLFDLIKKTKAARIINVSSSAHLLGKLNRDDLQLSKDGAYASAGWQAYGNSKLANILFTRELNRRLQESGNSNNIVSATLHPGACRTELGRYIFDPASIPKLLAPVLGVVASPLIAVSFYFTKDAFMGSQTQTYLSASTQVSPASAGGVFFDNSSPAGTSSEAQDANQAKWLWSESERLTGASFNV